MGGLLNGGSNKTRTDGGSIRTIGNLMRGRALPFVKIRRFLRFNVIECDKAVAKYKQRSALR
jgi:hypothetical protein